MNLLPVSPMYFIGADPDLHNVALAVVDDAGVPCSVGVVEADGSTGRGAVVQMVLALHTFWCGLRVIDLFPLEDIAGFVVEGQELYAGAGKGRTQNPRDIVFLSAVAGAILNRFHRAWPKATMYFPSPQEWKGSVPKDIHQARTCAALGWTYKKAAGYCVPEAPPTLIGAAALKKSDWKHVLDAIALARWARDEHFAKVRRASMLAKANVGDPCHVIAPNPYRPTVTSQSHP